jgi:hypothetical protein
MGHNRGSERARVLLCVVPYGGCAGDEFARAYSVVVCSGPEAVGVCGVEAVPGGKAGDGGENEVMTCLYRRPDGWGGLVAFRWGACGMGWVGRGGVVGTDLCPHALLRGELQVLLGEGPPDVLLVPPELRLCMRPGLVPFAGPKGEGISGRGV